MDRIKARYPLNRKDRRVIKRYEKRYPGELAHIDLTAVPRDLSRSLHCRELYSGAVCDDCTRLTYAEVLRDKKNFTLTYFFARALSWFQQIYHFEFAAVLSDNGGEFKGTLAREHPFETFCQQTGIRHHYTRAYRPQTNGKIEAFCKIVKHEFLEPNDFASLQELVLNLGGFLFQFNHLRLHGGLNHITPFDKLRKTTELLS
jgi:transposase InsO family protein